LNIIVKKLKTSTHFISITLEITSAIIFFDYITLYV